MLVVPGYGKREIAIGAILAALVVVLIVFAVMKLGTDKSPNVLRGVVTSHYQTGERETLFGRGAGKA